MNLCQYNRKLSAVYQDMKLKFSKLKKKFLRGFYPKLNHNIKQQLYFLCISCQILKNMNMNHISNCSLFAFKNYQRQFLRFIYAQLFIIYVLYHFLFIFIFLVFYYFWVILVTIIIQMTKKSGQNKEGGDNCQYFLPSFLFWLKNFGNFGYSPFHDIPP